ncbi:hypothetical protein D8674_020341 [Pyrus ussuriensis x Pyrus communis]|uniref:Protein LITTLE ZIPPER 1-like n=1 Tax=Pyrus ussuriensis x Pyrus communis TaxID=2448454 RepID=A0A5N5HJF8_9ROSA|nr:hypothetical protein D8674_020341 [Pyrus ussuriensis x Pyrus communis]
MCLNSEMSPSSPLYSSFRLRRPSKQHSFRVRRLINRNWKRKPAGPAAKEGETGGAKVEMEMKNLKLYMENQSIIEENNKLRRKALLLVQENQALFSQLQQKRLFLNKTTAAV